MNNYKVGDKVWIVEEEGYCSPHIEQMLNKEIYLVVERVDGYNVHGDLFWTKDGSPAKVISDCHTDWRFSFKNIAHMENKMEEIKFGDLVQVWDNGDSHKCTRVYLGRTPHGHMVAYSDRFDMDNTTGCHALREEILDEEECFAMTDEVGVLFFPHAKLFIEEVKEVTMEEIADKFGVDVSNLRIKE